MKEGILKKGFCPECEMYAIIVDGELQCCGRKPQPGDKAKEQEYLNTIKNKPPIPKRDIAYCLICGEPIKKGIPEPGWEVICWKCTANRVDGIRKLEEEAKVDIKNTSDIEKANDRIRALEENEFWRKKLIQLRKSKKWSQKMAANYLKVSQPYYALLEKGERQLTQKTIDILKNLL